MYADAVIEGGGVKAIGLVGAIYEAEQQGYKWRRLAGTSAGSIIATLLAAGYTAQELKKEMMSLDFSKFTQKNMYQCIPVAGDFLNLMHHYGIYSSDYIEKWVSDKLHVKGIRTFRDLDTTLYIIASDITSGEILVLPNDLKNYGIDPDSFEIAKAVRMSSSIPYFFQPVKLKIEEQRKKEIHYIVDGGLLSNFPVWIFDNEQTPRWPTFGFRLVSEKSGQPHKINGLLSLSYALISTMIEAHDSYHIKEQDFVRTMMVPTLGIKATDFHITKKQSEELFEAGVQSGKRFFDSWSFHQYVIKYRVKNKLI